LAPVNGLIDTLLGGGDVAENLLTTFYPEMGNFQAAVAAASFDGLGFARVPKAPPPKRPKPHPPAGSTPPLDLGAAEAPTNDFAGMVE